MRDSAAISKREKIIESALILFAERGFHGTNVPAIAALADVGTGTIYRYFKSKEELVNTVYQIYTKELFVTISSNFPFRTSIHEQYRHIMNRLILFANGNKKAFIFIETHNHAVYLDRSSKQVINEIQCFLTEFINKGVAQGKIRGNLSSEALISIVYGAFVALFKRIEAGSVQETQEVWEGFIESGWDAIKLFESF